MLRNEQDQVSGTNAKVVWFEIGEYKRARREVIQFEIVEQLKQGNRREQEERLSSLKQVVEIGKQKGARREVIQFEIVEQLK